jgi:hypothetical protein
LGKAGKFFVFASSSFQPQAKKEELPRPSIFVWLSQHTFKRSMDAIGLGLQHPAQGYGRPHIDRAGKGGKQRKAGGFSFPPVFPCVFRLDF